jgi:hypothetical protein
MYLDAECPPDVTTNDPHRPLGQARMLCKDNLHHMWRLR